MIGLDPSSNRFGRIAQRAKTRRSGWVRCPRRSTRSSNLAVCGRDRRDRAAGKRRSCGARHLLTKFGGRFTETSATAPRRPNARERSPAPRSSAQPCAAFHRPPSRSPSVFPELDERLGRSVGLVAALGFRYGTAAFTRTHLRQNNADPPPIPGAVAHAISAQAGGQAIIERLDRRRHGCTLR